MAKGYTPENLPEVYKQILEYVKRRKKTFAKEVSRRLELDYSKVASAMNLLARLNLLNTTREVRNGRVFKMYSVSIHESS